MPTLRGHMPPLPYTILARQFDEFSFVVNATVEIADELEILENHMKTCSAEYHHAHRCELLEAQATCNERVAELHAELGIGDN